MAILAEKFMKMSLDEIARLFPSQKCECGAVMEEHPDEQYAISGKPVCSDCYFSALGKEIERHPIYNPTRIARSRLSR
ncbi:hypothetical protein HY450_00170 [Candidatus Pacearchaeota archaeon]|nr:hypothetical protein [Candidatus Pacearchaeota archaeon]